MKIKKYQKPAGVLPSMVSTQLRNIRQKIADSKWGPRIAQELGIKPKEIELPDGTKTTINGGSSIIGPEMIVNPVGAAVKTTKVITKASPALKKGITIAEKLGIPKGLRSNPKALEDPYYWGYKQWNDRYSTAVKSGNIEEAQRLRDLHFKTKTHNNKIAQTLYRGERHLNDAYKWTIGSVERPGMMFTTPEPALASSYADLYTPYSRAYGLTKQLIEEQNALKQSKQLGTLAPEIEQQWLAEIEDIKKTISSSVLEQSTFKHPRFRKFYLYSKNPKTFDAKGSWWSNIGKYDSKLGRYPTTDDLAISAKKSGYDALKIKNVRDTGNNDIFFNQNLATDIVVLDGHKVKLADPITRTDSGELIPIVKRDNFWNQDMRFKQGGILKAQNGIKYTPTSSNTELPEIEGYKPQFSNFWYGGDETKKEESVPVQEEPIQETPVQVETPVQSEWSDIKSMIKKHEGFTGQAKKSFGEPNPTVGYGFLNVLPDGRKITDNMTMTEQEADRQLDIAIDKLRKNISSAVSSYNMKISDNQLNVLIDLGYHGGAGLVGRLLKEANGDINKIPGLLSRYATTAKYGDTSIAPGLKKRAQRRVEGWNKG